MTNTTGFRNRPHKAPLKSSIGVRKGSLKKPAVVEEDPCTAYEFTFTGKVILHSREQTDSHLGAKLVNPNRVRQLIRQAFTNGFKTEVDNLFGTHVLAPDNIHRVEIKNGDMFPMVQIRKNVYSRKK